MAGVVFFMSTLFIYQVARNGNLHSVLTNIAWVSAGSSLAYMIFIRPKVTFFDEGIMITNPFIEETVGWQNVREIESRYCLTIVVDERKIYAWAAPAPGRHHARNVHRTELKGLKLEDGDSIRAGESPRAHSGVASHLAKLRIENFQAKASIRGCESKFAFNTVGVVVLVLSVGIGLLLNAIHF